MMAELELSMLLKLSSKPAVAASAVLPVGGVLCRFCLKKFSGGTASTP